MKNKIVKTFLPIVAISLFLLGCVKSELHWNATNITGVMPPLSFTLVDQNNRPVTEKTYQGKVNVLFFGYTNCPDVCPYTLGKLSSILHRFSAAEREHINVLFVSVDPKRDTAPIRKKYCAAFGTKFYGLSGTMPQLNALNRRYRVTFGYGDKDAKGNYEVSHSSAIYVFDPKGEVRLLVRGTEKNTEIAQDLKQLIKIST